MDQYMYMCYYCSEGFEKFSELIKHLGTGYDYLDLPGLGNNNEKLGLPERLSTGIQFRFRNLFHGKKSGNRNFIC
jgi:hypothetical protein